MSTFRIKSWANWKGLRECHKKFIRETIRPRLDQLVQAHAGILLNHVFEAVRQHKGKSARVKFMILEETLMEDRWFSIELTYVFVEGFWEPY